MIVRNATPFPTEALPEYDDVPRVTLQLVTKVTLAVQPSAVSIATRQAPLAPPSSPEAPSGEVIPQLFTHGVGVTVIGSLRARDWAFDRATVVLRLGPETRSLLAFGPRFWMASGSDLVATAPLPTWSVPMSWSVAMGGRFAIPPGFLSGTRIPAPSTEISFPANPGGVGFYRHASEATGNPLPQLEEPTAPIRRWSDRPAPTCWAPLPRESSLRMADLELGAKSLHGAGGVNVQASLLSDAPRSLRFAELVSGSSIRLTLDAGGGEQILLACALPRAPFRVVAHVGDRSSVWAPVLEHLQLRLDEAEVALRYRTIVREPLIAGESRVAILEPDVEVARQLMESRA